MLTQPGRAVDLAMLAHQGRRWGRIYLTPINVFWRRGGGLSRTLTCGRGDVDQSLYFDVAAAATVLGAKPPRHVPRWLARLVAGEEPLS